MNIDAKIENLIQEGISKLFPVVGAAGLGYLGYHGAGDMFQGYNDQLHAETGLGALNPFNAPDSPEVMKNHLFDKDYPSMYNLGKHMGHNRIQAEGGNTLDNLFSSVENRTRVDPKLVSQGLGAIAGASIGHSLGKSLKGNRI
jgi:hypothetical protein